MDSPRASAAAGVFAAAEPLPRWVRPLIIVGVLGLAAFLAWRPSVVQLAVLAGLAGLIFVARWPGAGVLTLVVGALVIPFGVGTGTETEINLAVLFVLGLTGLWVLDITVRRRLQLVRSRPLAPLGAFAVVSVLAFAVGLQPWLPLAQTAPLFTQIGGLMIFLLSFCAFLLSGHRLGSERWLQATVVIFVALGGAYVVNQLVFGLRPPVRVFADGGDGSVFWVWLVAIAVSQAVLNRRLAQPWRLALVGVALIALFCGLGNRDWTSGWLPPLLAVMAILLLGAPRLLLVVGVAGAAYVVWKFPELAQAYVLNDYKQYDLLTRAAAWDIMMEIIRIEPILGIGFANYYWYTPLYPILGYSVRFNSHNNYIDLAAETGVFGVVCFAWLMLEVGLLAWRLRTRVPDGFARAYVYGAIGGLVGTVASAFLGDWVLPFVYNIGMSGFRASVLAWLFLGALLFLERRYGAPHRRSSPGVAASSSGSG